MSSTACRRTTPQNNVRVARVNGVYQPMLQVRRVHRHGRSFCSTAGISSPRGQARNVGAVVAAYFYWDWFMNPILNFGDFYNQLMMAMAGGERVFNLLDTQPDVQDLPDAKPLPRIDGQVKFENVTFGYNPERPVLHDINFERRTRADGRAGRRDRQRQEQHRLADRALLSAAAGPRAGRRAGHPLRHRRIAAQADGTGACR